MPAADGRSPAPIDRPILEGLRDRLRAVDFVADAAITDDGHIGLQVLVAAEYYPASVSEVDLLVRWYANDDFTIHYREHHAERSWERRWDRHPNPHNDRDHYHPPPDAGRAEDASWPADYRDVISLVLDAVETRLQTLWE
ncbi:MAG: hypothetical protein ACQEQY_09615 [Halobacteriota archaeon]